MEGQGEETARHLWMMKYYSDMEDFIHALNQYIGRLNPYARIIYKKNYEPTSINIFRTFRGELYVRIPERKPIRLVTVQMTVQYNHSNYEQLASIEMMRCFIEYSQTEEFKELMNGIAVQQIPVDNRSAEPEQ